MKTCLLFLICTLSFNISFAQGIGVPLTRQVDQETINLLETLQKDIKTTPNTTQMDCITNTGEKCDFMLMCNKFRPNRNSKALYKNPDGQIIPNYKLLYLQDTVDQCKNSISASTTSTAYNPYSEMQKIYSKNRKAFLNSVQAHREEANMIKIEQAMLDASLEATTNSNENSWFVSKIQAEKNITDAEKRAGIKLSDESKKKWIELFEQPASTYNPSAQTNVSSSDNPFIKTELLTNAMLAGSKEKVKEYQAEFQKETNRSFEIFTDTKSQLIAVLNKRKDGKNNSEIDNMIYRINKIRMNQPMTSPAMMNMSPCSSPNAFYDPISHSFTLCPQLLQMPSATIQSIIAHELGHSIDPCTATYPLESIEGTPKQNPYSDYLNAQKDQQNTNENSAFLTFNPTLPDQGSEKLSAYDVNLLKDYLSFQFDNLSFKEKQQSVELKKNPFSSVVKCLQDNRSVGARMGDIKGAKSAIFKKISDLQQSGASDSDPKIKELKQTLDRIDAVYADKIACSFMGSQGGHSQMQEAFSDWIASEVIANKIKTAPNKQIGQQIAFEANGFFAAVDCKSYDLDIAEKAKSTLEKAGCLFRGSNFANDMQNMQLSDDPHPEGYNRINKIFMANPTTASALSCEKKFGVKYCE